MTEKRPSQAPAISRRTAFGLAALATAAATTEVSAQTTTSRAAGVDTIATPDSAVVSTRYGKVRGYLRNGIYTFKGIPYGADTGGANRWLPAKAPQAWTDTLPALTYGPVCPHPVRADWGKSETQFVYDWDDGFEREDMLRVNVWTKTLGGSSKKPVMIFIHGGGLTSGSSQELPSYDGENLAKRDVVFVSLNHRLNALGFLDLTKIGGEAYRDSANICFTDLVFALEWVRANIAAFGGDPGNVTLCGQSGGGGKISYLMAMPSAKGLFHRAIIQSSGGAGADLPTPAQSQAFAAALMVELGLAPNDLAGLQRTPHQTLLAAGQVAARKVNAGAPRGAPATGFGPTFDGRVLPEKPFNSAAPAASASVPLIVGSLRDESFSVLPPMTEAELKADLDKTYGAKGPTVLAALKTAYPKSNPTNLKQSVSGFGRRLGMLKLADMKAAQGGAPVYNYLFTWSPETVLEGRSGVLHCIDLAFCLDNVKRSEQLTGNTPAAQSLAQKMSQAWINFARTGDPSQPGLAWTPYDSVKRTAMIWDNAPKTVSDPFSDLRKVMIEVA
jgi:para-nitrobenzyl esterase